MLVLDQKVLVYEISGKSEFKKKITSTAVLLLHVALTF